MNEKEYPKSARLRTETGKQQPASFWSGRMSFGEAFQQGNSTHPGEFFPDAKRTVPQIAFVREPKKKKETQIDLLPISLEERVSRVNQLEKESPISTEYALGFSETMFNGQLTANYIPKSVQNAKSGR